MIVLTLPLPPATLSPNAHVHWAKRASAAKKYRTTVNLIARRDVRASARGRWRAAEVRITWYHPSIRHPDPDNALSCCKSLIDGLRDAGLIADDDRLRFLPIEFGKDGGQPRVEITITAADAAA